MTAPEALQFDRLIGSTVSYNGCRYKVVDYLAQDQSLILRSLQTEASIQINQFGNATRRVPQTLSIAVYSSAGQVFPEVLEWLERN